MSESKKRMVCSRCDVAYEWTEPPDDSSNVITVDVTCCDTILGQSRATMHSVHPAYVTKVVLPEKCEVEATR